MTRTENAPVGELHLSVRAERAVQAAGIRTVGELRARLGDLPSIGLRGKIHRVAIEKALVQWEEALREREVLIAAAREAMTKLTSDERARVHAEVGCCTCANVGKLLGEQPRMAVGVLLGAAIGALSGKRKKGA